MRSVFKVDCGFYFRIVFTFLLQVRIVSLLSKFIVRRRIARKLVGAVDDGRAQKN